MGLRGEPGARGAGPPHPRDAPANQAALRPCPPSPLPPVAAAASSRACPPAAPLPHARRCSAVPAPAAWRSGASATLMASATPTPSGYVLSTAARAAWGGGREGGRRQAGTPARGESAGLGGPAVPGHRLPTQGAAFPSLQPAWWPRSPPACVGFFGSAADGGKTCVIQFREEGDGLLVPGSGVWEGKDEGPEPGDGAERGVLPALGFPLQ